MKFTISNHTPDALIIETRFDGQNHIVTCVTVQDAPEPLEFWVNIYEASDGCVKVDGAFDTKEAADASAFEGRTKCIYVVERFP